MNSKPTILVEKDDTIFQAWYLEDIWKKYFNVEIIDYAKNYDKKSTIFVNKMDCDKEITRTKWLHDSIPHVLESCWDGWDGHVNQSNTRIDYIIRARDFFLINESIHYKKLGYMKFDLTNNATKDFLFLCNDVLLKPHRLKFFKKLVPFLKNNIYSYVGKGIILQNAKDISKSEPNWQRYIDPTWYTDTRFSLVTETNVENYSSYDIHINVTEKTYKPCAFKHPFIIYGQKTNLEHIQNLGFQTFNHCIDESYDLVLDKDLRLNKIIDQVKQCIKDKTIFQDSLTKEKIEYNYSLFYNQDFIIKLLEEQIIHPLMEFIHG